jgi:uncharacterized membrane protein
MSDNLLALVLERDKEIAALKAEAYGLRGALTTANETIVKLSQNFEAEIDRLSSELKELTEPISDAGHTVADGLRHEMQQMRTENDRLRKALERIANTYDDSWKPGSQERSIGDLARAALAKEGK